MRHMMTILTLNDDASLGRILHLALSSERFLVFACSSDAQFLRMSSSRQPDLICIQQNLPNHDRHELISLLRQDCQSPIIILADHPTDIELIQFLNIGATDYLGLPVNTDVLLAKVFAILRTQTVREAGASFLLNGGLRMDLIRHEVYIHGVLVGFTPKEYELLRYFLIHKGKMLSHRDILRAVWGVAHTDDIAYLRVFIGQVRKKIGLHGTRIGMITSENGIGYRMEIIEPDEGRAQSLIGLNDHEPNLAHPLPVRF